jgi:hypothetical protein
MDAALNGKTRYPLLFTALAPLIPHVLGSVFNIWYNMVVIDPMLIAAGLKERFIATVIVWNAIAYPAGVAIWLWLIFSLRPAYRELIRGETIPAAELDRVRRRAVHLPWYGAAISGIAWLLGAVVFLISLSLAGRRARFRSRALFGVDSGTDNHADRALVAGRDLQQQRSRRCRQHRIVRANGVHRDRQHGERRITHRRFEQDAWHDLAH